MPIPVCRVWLTGEAETRWWELMTATTTPETRFKNCDVSLMTAAFSVWLTLHLILCFDIQQFLCAAQQKALRLSLDTFFYLTSSICFYLTSNLPVTPRCHLIPVSIYSSAGWIFSGGSRWSRRLRLSSFSVTVPPRWELHLPIWWGTNAAFLFLFLLVWNATRSLLTPSLLLSVCGSVWRGFIDCMWSVKSVVSRR